MSVHSHEQGNCSFRGPCQFTVLTLLTFQRITLHYGGLTFTIKYGVIGPDFSSGIAKIIEGEREYQSCRGKALIHYLRLPAPSGDASIWFLFKEYGSPSFSFFLSSVWFLRILSEPPRRLSRIPH